LIEPCAHVHIDNSILENVLCVQFPSLKTQKIY
jgi:hypothetical protein